MEGRTALVRASARFSEVCLHRSRQALAALGGRIEEEQVVGRQETYWVLRLRGASPCEVYVYSDGGGIMLDGNVWQPFEAPDFSTEGELIDALVEAIGRLALREGRGEA